MRDSCRRSSGLAVFALAALMASSAAGERSVSGQPTFFTSPLGVKEACIVLTRAPGGVYHATDEAAERAHCSLDFHAGTTALCPRIWGMKAAALLYDVATGSFAGDAAGFEQRACAEGSAAWKQAGTELGLYKQSTNAAPGATFAPAALVTYHLSRWLDTRVRVPPAVFRTMEREAHRDRVAVPGERLTAGDASLGVIHAAWKQLVEAEAEPESAAVPDELFNRDRTQVFGAVLVPIGTRYGAELNGTSAPRPTQEQDDFQDTAPFLALRSEAPLSEAIDASLARARANAVMTRGLEGVGPEQVVLWMQELSEIVWLDFVLGQQRRVGNLDAVEEWTWVEDGRVIGHQAGRETEPPAELADRKPLRLRRTWLNENDTALRISYADASRENALLPELRHLGPALYRKALALSADVEAAGPVSQWLRKGFGLSDAELEGVFERAREASDMLRKGCLEGRLRLDLDPVALLSGDAGSAEAVDCQAP
jgi:hypothetical protein